MDRPAARGTVRSLYTGRSYDPAELIAEDFRITELRRAERTRVAALEADWTPPRWTTPSSGCCTYNCEHVVPQSWFG